MGIFCGSPYMFNATAKIGNAENNLPQVRDQIAKISNVRNTCYIGICNCTILRIKSQKFPTAENAHIVFVPSVGHTKTLSVICSEVPLARKVWFLLINIIYLRK